MEQGRIWDYFQNRGLHAFKAAEPRYEACVRAALRRHPGIGIALNVGIGSGGVERRLLEHEWSVCSLDLSEEAVARLKGLGIDARQGRMEAMPFPDGQFDVVIATEVLEHIPQPARAKAIAETARVLRPGGWFIGTVPYREDLRANEVICPSCGAIFHRWGHADSFDVRKLVQELSGHFRVVRCYPRTFVDWRRVKGPVGILKAVVKLVLGRMGEGIVYPSLFFEAQKRL